MGGSESTQSRGGGQALGSSSSQSSSSSSSQTFVNTPGYSLSASEPWVCLTCTYENQPTTAVCQMCNASRPMRVQSNSRLIQEQTKKNAVASRGVAKERYKAERGKAIMKAEVQTSEADIAKPQSNLHNEPRNKERSDVPDRSKLIEGLPRGNKSRFQKHQERDSRHKAAQAVNKKILASDSNEAM